METQLKMVGRIIILLFVLFNFYSCKNKITPEKLGKDLISQNINILIDSIERFDMRAIKRPKKFEHIKIEKISVGLFDSIKIEKNEVGKQHKNKFLSFTINYNDIKNYKSDYSINLTKFKNDDVKTVFVKFYNLKIDKNFASIIVKKIIGISMIEDIYYFKKENDKWVFVRKEFLGMG